MPVAVKDGTQQRICTSQPFCKCVGEVNAWDECCCMAKLTDKQCVRCGAALIVIDTNTGEAIAQAQEA